MMTEEVVPPKLVTQSEIPADRVGVRTMFDPSVSKWEIFWRNMLAGFGRALGGTIIYVAFLLIMGSLVSQLVFPWVKPYLDAYMQTLQNFNSLTPLTSGQSLSIPEGQGRSVDLNGLLSNPEVRDLIQKFQEN